MRPHEQPVPTTSPVIKRAQVILGSILVTLILGTIGCAEDHLPAGPDQQSLTPAFAIAISDGPLNLTQSPEFQKLPNMSGNFLVWVDQAGTSIDEIWGCDLSRGLDGCATSSVRLTVDVENTEPPGLSEGLLVWSTAAGLGPTARQLRGCDLGASLTEDECLGEGNYTVMADRVVFPEVAGDVAIWYDIDGRVLLGCDVTDGLEACPATTVTLSPDETVLNGTVNAGTDGSFVAWRKGTDPELFACDVRGGLGQCVSLATSVASGSIVAAVRPALSNGVLVWTGRVSSSSLHDVYGCDLSHGLTGCVPTNLTDDPGNDIQPDIHGNVLAWTSADGPAACDLSLDLTGCASTRLSLTSAGQFATVSGGTVAWMLDQDIYGVRLSGVTPPADDEPPADDGPPPTGFAVDKLQVEGNIPDGFVDEFDDGALTTDPTSHFNCGAGSTSPAVESGGFLFLENTNCILGDFSTEKRLRKDNGGATITAAFRADLPEPGQSYGIQVHTAKSGAENENVRLYVTDAGDGPVITSHVQPAVGDPPEVGDAVQGELIPLDLAGIDRIHLRLDVAGGTGVVTASYSTGGGRSYSPLPLPIEGRVYVRADEATAMVFGLQPAANQAPEITRACAAVFPGLNDQFVRDLTAPITCEATQSLRGYYPPALRFSPIVRLVGDATDDDGDPLTFEWTEGDRNLCPDLPTRCPNELQATFAPSPVPHVVKLRVSDGRGGVDEQLVRVMVPEVIVLVHGINGGPSSFGDFGLILAERGFTVTAFDYSLRTDDCSLGTSTPPDPSIADIGLEFGGFLSGLLHRTPQYEEHVNVVGFSMGGVVVRSFMTDPLYTPTHISKFVTIGTPHFGSGVARWTKLCDRFEGTEQGRELLYGNVFLWDLHATWRRLQPIKPEDMLTVAGLAATLEGDRVVQAFSATLPIGDLLNVAYVPCAHTARSTKVRECLLVDVETGDLPHPTVDVVGEFLALGTVSDERRFPDEPLQLGLAFLRLADDVSGVAVGLSPNSASFIFQVENRMFRLTCGDNTVHIPVSGLGSRAFDVAVACGDLEDDGLVAFVGLPTALVPGDAPAKKYVLTAIEPLGKRQSSEVGGPMYLLPSGGAEIMVRGGRPTAQEIPLMRVRSP